MSKIKQIDRATCKDLRPKILAALKELGEELGVGFSLGNASYSPENATFKLNIGVIAENGTAKTPEAAAFERMASTLGFKPEDLGKVFVSQGVAYKISGYKATRRKYPISATRVHDEKGFKFTVAQVKLALGLEVQPGDHGVSNRRLRWQDI